MLLSDTHGLHREIDMPDGDILLHAGDFTMFCKDVGGLREFNQWLGELPHRYKCVVPGNHEFILESDLRHRAILSNAKVLVNESITLLGLKIWGSPVTPLRGVAFGLSSAAERRAVYSSIADDTDVLITHGPPFGILDSAGDSELHSGCRELLDAVSRVKPRLHVFGHCHGGHGLVSGADTLFVNAAMLGLDGNLAFQPTVVQLRST